MANYDIADIVENVGPQTDIGVCLIDSCYQPNEEFIEFNRVGRTIDIFDGGAEGNPHWQQVLQVLAWCASDPIYHFIKAIGTEDGKFRDDELLRAFGRILDFKEEIDVVNISAGLDHISDEEKDCSETGPHCAVCSVARDIVEEGITIVSGAGNYPKTDNVCCPSLDNAVIAVGGVVAKCTASISRTDPLVVSDSPKPPNALWIERDDDKGFSDAFCSDRGCLPGESCQTNRKMEPWENNVEPIGNKPDILAPAIVPSVDEIGPVLGGGTSFAVPIVTAQIANSIMMSEGTGIDPSPGKIRRSLKESAQPLEDYSVGYISGDKFAANLAERYGLQFEREEDDLTFEIGPDRDSGGS